MDPSLSRTGGLTIKDIEVVPLGFTDMIPAITRYEMQGLATTEYARAADQLRSLTPGDWSKPTDCPLWDVRAMAGHTLGMMSDFTSFRNLMRRMRAATKAAKEVGGPLVDSMTAMQVGDHADRIMVAQNAIYRSFQSLVQPHHLGKGLTERPKCLPR